MQGYSRQVLDIDLEKRSFGLSSFADLGELLGGLGVGLQLVSQFKNFLPTVFSVGPLNGCFPFAAKFCCLSLLPGGLVESYISGRFALMMRFANLDSLLIRGIASRPLFLSIYPGGVVEFVEAEVMAESFSKAGVAGRRSFLTFADQESFSDDYFIFDQRVGRKLYLSNLRGIVLSAGLPVKIAKEKEYHDLYQQILARGGELEVAYGDQFSCGGCPAGCNFSREVEERFELTLSHCLVACGFARRIYEEIPLVFSCLNSLGFPYKHEDLETLPQKIAYLKASF